MPLGIISAHSQVLFLRLIFVFMNRLNNSRNQVKHLPKVNEAEDKIVGGHNVDISERPFQVVFEWYGSLICGGAWIGGNKVRMRE